MKYSFIAQHKKTWPINLMYRVLGVKRNGYYCFQTRNRDKPEDPEHNEMLAYEKREHFAVMFLDNKHVLINFEILFSR